MGIAVVEVVAVGTYRSKCGDLIWNCDIVTQVRGQAGQVPTASSGTASV